MRSRKAAVAIALVLACNLLIAAAASAGPRFQAEDYPLAASGEQSGKHVFTVENGVKIECSTVTFTLEASEPSEVQGVAPDYEGCLAIAFGFEVEAEVKMEGCSYDFRATEELEADKFEGTVDIVCPGGKSMLFKTSTCEVQVGAQSGLAEIEYVNNTKSSPEDLTVKANLSGVKYTKLKDGFLCPLTGTGTKEDGAYTGDELVKATHESEAQPVGVRQAVLCKVAPDGQGVCPKGEGYIGKVNGTIAAGTAKIEKSLTEFVTCKKVVFEGDYDATAEGKGEKFTIEGSETEKECESSLPGKPKVAVSMLGLPSASYFEYKLISGGFQGVFYLGSRKTGGLQMVIEGVTCKYKPGSWTTGFVANAGAGPTLVTAGSQYTRETINAKCPVNIALSVILGLTRGKDNVYLAKKVAA